MSTLEREVIEDQTREVPLARQKAPSRKKETSESTAGFGMERTGKKTKHKKGQQGSMMHDVVAET